MGRQASLAVLPVLGAIVAGAALAVSCGSRTGLLLPGQGGQGGASSSSGGGAGGPTPLAVKCAAALLDGAPTPMQGYCPTRANQAPGNGPKAPQIAWTATPFAIDEPENYLPASIVVDPVGTAYVVIDASPMNPTGSPNQVFAIDPDGTVAWTTSLPAPTYDPALAAEGRVWLAATPGVGSAFCPPDDGGFVKEVCEAALIALSPTTGQRVALVDVLIPFQIDVDAPGYGTMAMASDGSFFLESVSNSDLSPDQSVARVSSTGTVQWQWPPFQGAGLQLVPPLIVGPSDDVVGTDGINVVLLDAVGNQVWQEDVDVQLAAVNAQGAVVALSTDKNALLTLDVNGNTLETIPLAVTIGPTDAAQLAIAGDGTILVLLANEATSPGLTKAEVQIYAIDASGQTRWSTTLQAILPYDPATLTTHYGLFVDASGTVIVTAGSITGIDLASGTTLWTLQPPHAQSCLRPAVLGANGAILASQCDGTIFLARDP
jgi:hypothetical protein